MNNLTLLLKIEFQKFLSSFKTKNKKKVTSMPIFYVALLIGGLAALAAFGYSFIFVTPFVQAEVDSSPAVSIFAGITSLFVFMTAMNQARGIYIGDDYDFLSSLPIKKKHIVASKIIFLYVFELVFSFIIMVPHGIAQIVIAHNVSLFLICLLLAFTLPIVPIAFAVVISLLVTLLTAKFKSANFVFVILYAIIIAAFSGMSMIISRMSKDQAAANFSTMGNVLQWVNPSYYFVELSFTGNKLFLLLYVGMTLAIAIVSVLFLALAFDKLHEIVSSVRMKKEYVRKDLKNKGEVRLFYSLEFKRLFNSKFYFTNTIMGSIMAIMGTTVFLVSMTQPFATASQEAIYYIKLLIGPIFVTTVMLILGLVTPTTGVINIEGKNFWLTKSLPIDYKKYMHAKLLFSWTLTIPAAIIASTIEVIFNHDVGWEIAFVYIIPIIFVIVSSLVGLIVAMDHPKLKWNSEAEAIKNSASVLIALIINVLLSFILGAGLIVIPAIMPQFNYVGYLATTVLLILFAVLLYSNLNKNFAKKIEEIEEL